MKNLKIICVGKIKEDYLCRGIDEALTLIRRKCPVSVTECADEPTPDGAGRAAEELIKDKEGQRILSRISDEDYVVALCIEGKRYSSTDWYAHLHSLKGRLPGSLTFVIGGSLGLSDQVIRRADEKLSFSSMTFPHQLMRLILLDQIASWVRTGS